MSLSDEQFNEQLPLFVSAADVKAKWAPHDKIHVHVGNPADEKFAVLPEDAFWEQTEAGARRRNLADSLTEHGVRSPVSLSPPSDGGRGEVLGGHHRIAYMAKHHPDSLVPVVFHTDFDEAEQEMDAYFGGYNNDAVASASWKPRDWRAR